MSDINEYNVAFMCVCSDSCLAESPEQAAEIVSNGCVYDIDGSAHVVNLDTGEEWDI